MHRSILERFPQADVSASIVWIPMYGTADTEAAAIRAAQIIADPRVRHFSDPEKLAGKAFASSLGAPAEVAWDVYLFYEPGQEWRKGEGPPAPVDWMHQLSTCSWADPSRLRCGDRLLTQLHETMKKLVACHVIPNQSTG